jgi:hypothetical protein
VNQEQARTQAGGFLRQRYLACKSVIYRPYLTWALSTSSYNSGAATMAAELPPSVYEGCEICLNACWLHAQNLRSFLHTVMVDTWICSLS